MRAFVAIELPRETRVALGALQNRLRAEPARASWVAPDNIHLTLRFLGEITSEAEEGIAAELRARYAAMAPLTLAPRGLGYFPNARRPSVLWVGVDVLAGNLEQVQEAAETAARHAGLPPESKPFRAHLTLARFRDPREAAQLRGAVEAAQAFAADAFEAAHVSLFRSELLPRGAKYTRLHEFALAEMERYSC